MPRKRAAGYDNQRETIIEQAAALFARNGFVGTSMNEVALACGLSKASLYHYFADKHQLLMHICEDHIDRLCALVDEVAQQELDPEPRLRLLIQRFVEEYRDAQNEHRVLTEDVRFLEPGDQKRILTGERKVVKAVAEAMCAVRPELDRSRMAKPLAMLLFGMINWMFMWLKPDGELTHERMAVVVSDLLFGGIGAVSLEGTGKKKR
ncbi:TetR/AcrR family transcriptional regulator [Herbaspirillum huttiense]|jgi:transcriptional regulator, TetR family|uniref:TetR/AcrR family transcriptional regulator n=1 Tax=Herbaspirillum huttiense subsp. lycopersici TaxID=3074428 RepID=A0ABU2EQ46_9BURK|nr:MULTISPECIES: TetR/AcrR family transcriptional regulator [Herbaspirillum]MAF05778.1 TetR/AcrR family transcriptional regulator [Herbaspirillum sp.]MBN9355846.1 TetR family transcriptional regulator [Herbaspirillum huttiense]MBO16431.1 TetR/AcrR family transcriptional regulator [Herbaspirillum sp.]MBP1317728.1 TetR/AcrR family transcriptional regulator [Herbaspirillum sp. 1130]MCP3654835.1 TetR/AcrR family transcriptional regulator [Herbaspirillum sp.]|tara:strand:- start:2985 stop:3605 length:621 start_codon:yes stop_codon:yes gene_type:complete